MRQKSAVGVFFVFVLLLVTQYGWGDREPFVKNVESPSGFWKATITPSSNNQSINLSTNELISYYSHVAGKKLSVEEMASWATVKLDQKNKEFHRYTLRNPVMPQEVTLLDDGTLITFDQWKARGFGEVCSAYAPNGVVLWSKTLEEFVGQEHLKSYAENVLGRWWRLDWSIEPEKSEILIRLTDENILRIQLADGKTTFTAISDYDLSDMPKRIYNRACALVNAGKIENAVGLLEQARQASSDDPALDYLIPDKLMTLYDSSEKTDQAVEVGKNALKRLAGRGEESGLVVALLYAHMANIQEKMGYLEESEQSLRAAIAAKPDHEVNNLALAKLLYRIGQPEKADAVLREALRANEGSNNMEGLCLNIGDFFRRMKQPVQARDYFLKAYQSDRVTNANLYIALAETYEDLNDLPAALKLYEQLEKYFISGTPEKQQMEQKVIRLQKELGSE